RRGRVLGMKMEEGLQILEAEVPLAEMFSYSSQLRSITQGRGSFDMEFARYEPVPSNIAQQIMEQAAREREEEDA
ncbi:MAG: elongation factor G, partial [Lentisphaerae bacterium]